MYNTFGFQYCIKNIYKLVITSTGTDKHIDNADDLRIEYLKFLNGFFPNLPINETSNIICTPELSAKLLFDYFGKKDQGDFKVKKLKFKTLDNSDNERHQNDIYKAYVKLLSCDPELAVILKTIIHSVVVKYNEKSFGGSNNNAIGVIWTSINDMLTTQDIQEILLHELTHNLLYIDELLNEHYDLKQLYLKDSFSPTAIFGKMKSANKVTHSIIVASEVLQYRVKLNLSNSNTNVHPDSEILLKNCNSAYKNLKSLKNYSTLISDHMKVILDTTIKNINSLHAKNLFNNLPTS